MTSPIEKRIRAKLPDPQIDVVFVDGGEVLGPPLLAFLKSRFGVLVNYNIDDPFGNRDGQRWRQYLRSLAIYDLVVVVREENVAEAQAAGAQRVIRVPRSADELAHAPRLLSEADRAKWGSEVVFVGTWMPERGPFLAQLIQLGVPLSVYGSRWEKSRQWKVIRNHWRGPAIHNDDDYAKSIQGAKVCLGLLSKGNRDQSTTRSFEIPQLGGLFCAERTREHLDLYKEDEEAVFFNTPDECARKCRELIQDDGLRKRIAENGHRRCLSNGSTNEVIMNYILREAFSHERTSKLTHSHA